MCVSICTVYSVLYLIRLKPNNMFTGLCTSIQTYTKTLTSKKIIIDYRSKWRRYSLILNLNDCDYFFDERNIYLHLLSPFI